MPKGRPWAHPGKLTIYVGPVIPPSPIDQVYKAYKEWVTTINPDAFADDQAINFDALKEFCMNVSPIQIKIGDYELHPVPTGEFGLDGGAMFGTVPKVLWEKSNPADDKNRIRMEARGLLLKGKKNILIDCGNGSDFVDKYGEKLGNKFAELYKNRSGRSNLKQSFKQGLTPENIDMVILTHLHFDHAGGGVTSKNGKLVPTFPNAKYYVQKKASRSH